MGRDETFLEAVDSFRRLLAVGMVKDTIAETMFEASIIVRKVEVEGCDRGCAELHLGVDRGGWESRRRVDATRFPA